MIASNRTEVFAAIAQLNPINGVESFVDQVNTLLGSLYSMSQYQCINECETCLNDVCGILETSALSSTSNNIGNLSLSEILAGNFETLSSIANATFIFSNCVTFMGSSVGKICFMVDFDTVPIPLSDAPCTIEYNGVACNSCVIPDADFLTGGNCFTADCTNIDASAMLNSCNGTGFVGPFVFLNLLETKNVTNGTFTVGSCNGAIAPVSPSDPATAPTPLSVPTAAPVITSMTEPSVEPIASAPTRNTTASPIAIPVATPVRAPVVAPVSSRPAPIATSGSLGPRNIGGIMLLFLLGLVVGAM
jgi:hypothetical protein